MENDNLRLDKQICHRLYLASNGLTRLYRPLLSPLNITYPQYILLLALWEKDQISMGELAEKTSMDKGFLTTTIKTMNSKGLLSVKVDKHDSRKKIIHLLSKGKKLKEKAQNIPTLLSCKILEHTKADINIEQLIATLDALNSAIKKAK